MDNNIFLSIVMPTYNCKKYVGLAIESIQNQTFHNYEFIIVDGHSTDGTLEIIERYSATDKRIRVILDEKKGIGAALRLGCSLAKGDYIARMDSDDIAYPERLEKELDFLEHHTEYILVSSSAEYIDSEGNSMGYSFPYTWQCLLNKNVRSILHPGVLFRKSVYLKSGGYQPIIRSEDFFLWNRMKQYGRMKVLQCPLMKYRITDEALSNTTTESFEKNLYEYFKPFLLKKELQEEDLLPLNDLIRNNIKQTITSTRNPVRNCEMELLRVFNFFVSKKKAFQMVFCMKNLYGLLFRK